MDRFQEFLLHLSRAVHIDPPFYADHHKTCKLLINKLFPVQLEFDSVGENLIIASELYIIPPGRFRENILKSALKANGLPLPRIGTFAFIDKKSELILFELIPTQNLDMERMVPFLKSFIEKAESWRKALEAGQTHPPQAFPNNPPSLRGIL